MELLITFRRFVVATFGFEMRKNKADGIDRHRCGFNHSHLSVKLAVQVRRHLRVGVARSKRIFGVDVMERVTPIPKNSNDQISVFT